ncbi:MAG: hypothetical protein IJY05_00745 [Clostridia bacterium]|nr:hypothetical protein [Clostridia bacterium]
MGKISRKTLCALALTALCAMGAGVLLAENPREAKVSAAAQTAEQTTLVAPNSYEQYLELTHNASVKVSDVAVTENFTAVANDKTIFVYNRKQGVYTQYSHPEKVTKLQFSEEETLYFLDSAMQLYSLEPKSLTATRLDFSCNTFYIAGQKLFFTAISGDIAKISVTDLLNPDVYAPPIQDHLLSKPAITYWENELYYTDAGKYLYKIDPTDPANTNTFLAAFPSEIVSMAISENVLTCADLAGGFYSYNLADFFGNEDAGKATPIFTEQNGYSSLTLWEDFVYVVQEDSVRQYSLQAHAFTDYEIGSTSPSAHRLNGATETVLAGDKLLIADAGNRRISVYNTATETFETPISSFLTPLYLASNGETAVVANGETAIVYSLATENYGAELTVLDDFSGTLMGAACVFDTYYFITEGNYCYAASKKTAWTVQETKKSTARYAKLLTSDAYGNLYVGSGTSIFRYTEEEFLSPMAEGERVTDELPGYTKKISVDYNGSVYALNGNSIVKIGGESYDFSAPLVYTENANLVSFTFGVEENATYLLYAENYLAKTTALELPTVKTIPVGTAAEEIFSRQSANVELIRSQPNALAVEFDIFSLQSADYFPYAGYSRWETPVTALKLGETEQYNVVAVYDNTARKYTTHLLVKSDCDLLPAEEYRTDYPEAKTGWVSSGVTLYKFPYLTQLLTVTDIPRGAQVSVLGEIEQLDYPYYFVRYVDEKGVEHCGYVPQAHIANFDGRPPQSTQSTLGDTKSDKDDIWRFTYLLLGCGAICILVDYLIIRKKPKD